MNSLPLREYISEKAMAAGLNPDEIDGEPGSGGRTLRLVLDGKAKLPLDRIMDAAEILGCEPQKLFRPSLKQFYNDEMIALLEIVTATQITPDEQAWLDVVRSAAGSHMKPPSRIASRLIRALFR